MREALRINRPAFVNGWYQYAESSGDKTELKDIKLVKEDNNYYLDVTYTVENRWEKFLLNIPRVKLPIDPKKVILRMDTSGYKPRLEANIGFGSMHTEFDENGVLMTETRIEEKVHEMTLDEIEKILGYKVKIVNGK